jgi:hypothetical protein
MKRQYYSKEHVQNEFAQWCAGAISTKTMSKAKYNAMKKRCSRAGLKKGPSDFKMSTKLTPDAYITARKRYHRQWRANKRIMMLSYD